MLHPLFSGLIPDPFGHSAYLKIPTKCHPAGKTKNRKSRFLSGRSLSSGRSALSFRLQSNDTDLYPFHQMLFHFRSVQYRGRSSDWQILHRLLLLHNTAEIFRSHPQLQIQWACCICQGIGSVGTPNLPLQPNLPVDLPPGHEHHPASDH